VTSGTSVPYWKTQGEGLSSRLTDEKDMRPIGLALLDSDLRDGQRVQVEIRGAKIDALIVPYNLRSEAPPFARAILYGPESPADQPVSAPAASKVHSLLKMAKDNTVWRQTKCVNLIPSEMTPSRMSRLLSIMDPAGRYAEHKEVTALDFDVFYYQGTDFIEQVEAALVREMSEYLGCSEVEARVVSGQMANATVFSAMLDHINRGDRRAEPRRIRCVLNNHIMKGGHLSAQPMGALKDFVARDPITEKAAVVNFPVLADNPYKIDVNATREVLDASRPELIIFGKSMVLHPEPIAEIRRFLDDMKIDAVVMYDMAHVLGLVGPYFQEPFKEGADIVTGSTHKTFFGTQRGVIAGNFAKDQDGYHLWEAVRRRTFPGAVSNHHLGTMLGLLMSAYEMNYFKRDYQRKVLANAKAFAKALKDAGLDVAGDTSVSFTETHQVIVNVGYGKGPEIARLLEDNNIIVNYQASPAEEGFTASGSLRLGVSEMTRFGMEEGDFAKLAQLIHDVIVHGQSVKDKVESLRRGFLDMKFCFTSREFNEAMKQLHKLV
ncbi:MAG: glycine cleavage system protein T, partial [Planctomycetaceae bacterium]